MYIEPDWWYPYPKYKPVPESEVLIKMKNPVTKKITHGFARYTKGGFLETDSEFHFARATVIMFMEPSDGSWNIDNHIRLRWHINDVIERAEERDIIVTAEEAIEILYMVEKKADCNYGVSWDSLDFWTDEVIGG